MTKRELRGRMRERLKEIAPERAKMSRGIVERIAAHPAFLSSARVAIFAALPSEPDLDGVWEKGPRVFCFPRVGHEQMEFVEVASRDDLVAATWNPNVREPGSSTARIVSPRELDLILVPGLAFTRAGFRLGRGGGFYDRFLKQMPASTVRLGVCFDLQILDTLPLEPHDQRVDAVVTEHGIFPALSRADRDA